MLLCMSSFQQLHSSCFCRCAPCDRRARCFFCSFCLTLAIHPVSIEVPEKGLEKIPYKTTLIQMFEDVQSGIKTSAYSQAEIVDLFSNVTEIINKDCETCISTYGKKCNCKKLQKIARLTKTASIKLEEKIRTGKDSKLKKYATSRTKKTLKLLRNSPDNLVSYVEETSSFFLNETKCYKTQKSVLLITGGDGAFQKAEIFDPMTNSGCSLPDLPGFRYTHTQNDNLICGGVGTWLTTSSCLMWNSKSGTWDQFLTLNEQRVSHFSWVSDSGVYLLGGMSHRLFNDILDVDTTELVTESGVIRADLRNLYTLLVPSCIFNFRLKDKLVLTCAIPNLDGKGFILTGGFKEGTRMTPEVSVYTENGFQSNLASLNRGRFNHGCTSFTKEGEWVNFG